uniref:DUF7666 domain-containing protein n=1 Tax=Dulem virus 38 TaxID=3145756 RepID=A0AAU8B2G4_9CAUD
MTEITVRSQADWDALRKRADLNYSDWEICIRGGRVRVAPREGAGLDIRAYGTATVEAYDTVTVRAYGTSTVLAYDTATVLAYDTVTVEAYGTSTVEAYDTVTVRAYGTATVEAYDTSAVEAYDTVTVRACGTATVEAYDTVTVRAYDTVTVKCTPLVAIYKHHPEALASGGVLIDVSSLNLSDPRGWAQVYGAVRDGSGYATLYKALPNDLTSGQSYGKKTLWEIGSTVRCEDWQDSPECGHGLHLSPTPALAAQYADRPERFLECRVLVDTLLPILGGGAAKCKVPEAYVVREVDRRGTPVAP